jgi:hypothetical protein
MKGFVVLPRRSVVERTFSWRTQGISKAETGSLETAPSSGESGANLAFGGRSQNCRPGAQSYGSRASRVLRLATAAAEAASNSAAVLYRTPRGAVSWQTVRRPRKCGD